LLGLVDGRRDRAAIELLWLSLRRVPRINGAESKSADQNPTLNRSRTPEPSLACRRAGEGEVVGGVVDQARLLICATQCIKSGFKLAARRTPIAVGNCEICSGERRTSAFGPLPTVDPLRRAGNCLQ
jgi:hypothetical protein